MAGEPSLSARAGAGAQTWTMLARGFSVRELVEHVRQRRLRTFGAPRRRAGATRCRTTPGSAATTSRAGCARRGRRGAKGRAPAAAAARLGEPVEVAHGADRPVRWGRAVAQCSATRWATSTSSSSDRSASTQLAALARAPASSSPCAAALARRDPGAQARRGHRQADAIAGAKVAHRHGRELVDRAIQRSGPRPPAHRLDGCVEDQPHHVTLLALHLAHQKSTAPGAGLPCDAPEGSPGTWSRSSRISSPAPAWRAGRPSSEARRARPPRGEARNAAKLGGSTSTPSGLAKRRGTS